MFQRTFSLRTLCLYIISTSILCLAFMQFSYAAEKPPKNISEDSTEYFVWKLLHHSPENELVKRRNAALNLSGVSREKLKDISELIKKHIEIGCTASQCESIASNMAIHNSNYTAEMSAMEERFSHWVLNMIDDLLGAFHPDCALKGRIGLIESGATATRYAFTSDQGQRIAVTIGDSSLESDGGAMVYGYDWECFPGAVQIFLYRGTSLTSNGNFVLKISTGNSGSSFQEPLPECKSPKKTGSPQK